jgi:hypothetical protein
MKNGQSVKTQGPEKSKVTRTELGDLPESDGELSAEELDAVTGGVNVAVNRGAFGSTVLQARGTKERTNTNDNGSHDYDSEWDYSTY